jgi:hypothetical protein
MTPKELITELQKLKPDAEVGIVLNREPSQDDAIMACSEYVSQERTDSEDTLPELEVWLSAIAWYKKQKGL